MCPIFYQPDLKICPSDSGVEPESAILHNVSELLSFNNDNNGPHGLFNDKYPLHIIPHPMKKNTFINRISYDTQSNSYYENGIVDKKYLEFWDKGALYYKNLEYAIQHFYDRAKDMTSLLPVNKHSSSIIYKFDYSSFEDLEISLLNLRLKCFVEDDNYNWIISISTDKNNINNINLNNLNNSGTNSADTTLNSVVPSIEWIKIKETNKNISETLTYYVKNKKFFYIKVEIFWNGDYYVRNARLFPSTKIKRNKWNPFENNNNNNDDLEKNFTFDVIVELSSSSLLLESNNLTKSFKNLNCTTNKEKSKSSRNIINNNDDNKLILGGLFNDKYRFNVLQNQKKKDVYTHRIFYNAITNAYYENGNDYVKYLKRWDRGTFTHNNIYYFELYKNKTYLYKTSNHEKNLQAYITWKFDYRIGNLYLSSLKLKLKLPDIESIKWSIQLLPTRKNPNPEFKSIDLLQKNENLNDLNDFDYIMDLTEIVKDEYGFILKLYLNEIKTCENYRLFKYLRSCNNDGDFSMDIKMKLKPNIICDDNIEIIDEILLFNDKNTSDFLIKLELSKENENEKIFYTHKKILSSRSDYFHALLNSNMLESRNGCLKLNDISYNILEKLLLFIYIDNVENINEIEIDDWIDLLYASSKFLLPKLFQICELSIRNLTNFDNLENIEKVAYDCCSTQLLKFCEMFEVKSEKEKDKEEIIEIPNTGKPVSTVSVVKKFKNLIKI